MEGDAAYIDALFIYEKLGIRDEVTFCIDTGANRTCLFEREATNLGIDFSNLKRAGRLGGVGGLVNTRLLEDAKIGFPIDERRRAVVPFPTILILAQSRSVIRRIIEFLQIILSRLERKPRSESQRGLPNLLGFDFLKYCKISFSDTSFFFAG